jgi:hypothetical protein
MSMILMPESGPMVRFAPGDLMALSTAPVFVDVPGLVTSGRRQDQWFPAVWAYAPAATLGVVPAKAGMTRWEFPRSFSKRPSFI